MARALPATGQKGGPQVLGSDAVNRLLHVLMYSTPRSFPAAEYVLISRDASDFVFLRVKVSWGIEIASRAPAPPANPDLTKLVFAPGPASRRIRRITLRFTIHSEEGCLRGRCTGAKAGGEPFSQDS